MRERESGFRYTPTTCFETFPFPWPPGKEDPADPRVRAIAAAAKKLNELREAWLNPGAAKGGEILSEAELKKRTLTNLYNARPTWLHQAHLDLDRAVLAAYGWLGHCGDGIPSARHSDESGTVGAKRASPSAPHAQEQRAGLAPPLQTAGETPAPQAINPEYLYATRVAPAGATTKGEAAALEQAAERELLRRLLALNHERAATEENLPGKGRGKAGRKAKE